MAATTWRSVLRKPSGWMPVLWILVLVVTSIAAHWISPYDPNFADFKAINEPPSWAHLLGTDHLGRDVLSRLMVASRIALLAGLQAIGLGVVIGVPIGLIVGYVGGWPDRIAMRLVDVVFALPGLVVALTIVAILGPGLTNAMLAIGVLFATRFIRLTRGVVMSIREEQYVSAARVSGAPTWRVLQRYVLPNVATPLIVQLSMSFASVLLIEAALSFLGIGVQPPQATWGTMLREAVSQQALNPWLPWPPGVAITLTVLALNTFGDTTLETLRRAAPAPRRRRRRPAPVTEVPIQDQPVETGLLNVTNLVVEVPGSPTPVSAVRDLSFSIAPGEIVGLVGESGSGKTLTALAVAGLLPDGVTLGDGSRMTFAGRSIDASDAHQELRGREIAMVFQDPGTSLNPALTIGYQLTEPLRIHHGMSRRDARQRATEVLDRVGVADPASRLGDYPHQFSGGMAQRVMIAMALVAQPKLLIADEPTTALDVTTQKQVLELLVRLCEEEGMAMLFITHDLGIVAQVCDRAVVMYAGQAVETVEVFDLFSAPRHPYTRALLGSVPTLDQQGPLQTIDGRVPGPDEIIHGCRFASRCPEVEAQCTEAPPQLVEVGRAASHLARCRRVDEVAQVVADAPR